MRAEATDGLGFAAAAFAGASAEPLAGPFAEASDAAFAELLAASAEAAFAGASDAAFAELLAASAEAAFAGAPDAAFAAPGALEIFLAFFTDLRFVTTRFAPDRARRAYSGAMTSTPPM